MVTGLLLLADTVVAIVGVGVEFWLKLEFRVMRKRRSNIANLYYLQDLVWQMTYGSTGLGMTVIIF